MPAITPNKKPYGGGHFLIKLDNDPTTAGWIKDVDGGHAEGEVITEKLGADILFKKTISNVKYNDVSFKLGASASKSLYNWIENSFLSQYTQTGKGRTNGSILAGDYDFNQTSDLQFTNAIVTEVGMPALDASSKDAAAMSIKFTPESTRYKAQYSTSKINTGITAKPVQKLWTAANFILRIDGIDEDTLSRITKVDALTIKQKVVQHYTGKNREYDIEATSVETPNLVLTLAEAYAAPFFAWHEDFVIRGNCDDSHEKTGELLYLAQNVSESNFLFRLDFSQLGIFKITPEKTEQADKIRYVKVEMYCERIKFNYNSAYTQ